MQKIAALDLSGIKAKSSAPIRGKDYADRFRVNT